MMANESARPSTAGVTEARRESAIKAAGDMVIERMGFGRGKGWNSGRSKRGWVGGRSGLNVGWFECGREEIREKEEGGEGRWLEEKRRGMRGGRKMLNIEFNEWPRAGSLPTPQHPSNPPFPSSG